MNYLLFLTSRILVAKMEIGAAIGRLLEGERWAPDNLSSDLPGRNPSEQELAERLAALTPQQFRVLMLMMQGLLNKQIAFELEVSEATVKAHVTAIMGKLGVSNRTQAVVAAARLNVDDPNRVV